MAQNLFDQALDIPLDKWKESFYRNDDFFKLLQQAVEKDDIDMAIRLFISTAPREIAYIAQQEAIKLMSTAVSRELTTAEVNSLSADIAMVFRQTKKEIVERVRIFSTRIIAEEFFKMNEITSSKLQKAILDATLGQFERYIDGAMSQTPVHILNEIRSIQREWIARNQRIRSMSSVDDLLFEAEDEFRDRLRRKFPQYFKGIEDGDVLRSRLYGKNMDKVNTYTLEEYMDFSVRASVLNIDRQSVEMSAQARGHRVVEFYQRDFRKMKSGPERESCQVILKGRVLGKSLLALDEITASVLGIITLDRARELGSLGLHCRHSIKPVDAATRNEIDKVLHLSGIAGLNKQEAVNAV